MASPIVTGIACRLVTSCLLHMSKTSKIKQKKAEYRSFVAHEFGRFKLWAHGFDASPGRSGESDGGLEAVNDQLDEVLGRSKYLKEPTILLLSSFASCLLTKCFKSVGDSTTRTQLETALKDAIEIYPHIENDCDFGSDLSNISAMEELHDIVDTLYELAPALDDVLQKVRAPTDLGLPPVTMSYKNLIRDKFPNARGDLILRFAEGNTECYGKLRSLADRDATIVSKASGTLENAQGISRRLVEGCIEVVIAGPDPVSPSQIGSNVNPASFHDSGLGSSRPPTTLVSGSSPAKDPHTALPPINESLEQARFLPIPQGPWPQGPSSVSGLSIPAQSEYTAFSATSAKGNRPSTPRMPKEENWRIGFKCPLCAAQQKGVRNKHQWRTHVFSDLRPYMCIHGVCTAAKQSFPSKREWIAHQSSHKPDNDGSGVETCPFCLEEFESNWARFCSHVAHHMEDIRLFSLPPSQRQSGDPGVDDMSLDNSSCTGSEFTQSTKRSKNSVVLGEGPREETPGNSMKQQLKAYKQPNKVKLVGDWLSRSTIDQEVETDKFETNQVAVESEELERSETTLRKLYSDLAEHSTPSDDLLTAALTMASSFERQGKYENALEWFDRALVGRQMTLGEDHLDTLSTIHSIALMYEKRGMYTEALKGFKRVLAGEERALGEDHPNTLLTAHKVASIFAEEEKYDDALELFKKVLVGREKSLGKGHLDTLSVVGEMASIFRKQREYEKALEFYELVLVGKEQVLGKDHPDMLSIVHEMASMSAQLGKYDNAVKWFEQALAGREKTLGEYHPDTLTTVHNMATVFAEQRQYDKALTSYERVLAAEEKADNKNHAKTLITIHNMASVFRKQRKYDEALEWYGRVLTGRVEMVGEYHPDTLSTVHNMASVFRKQGKNDEARAWYERALAGREETLGKDHPSTKHTRDRILALG